MKNAVNRLAARATARLRDERGDTLVEVLTALLIVVLGATLLVTMVMSATNASTASRKELLDVYQAESGAGDVEETQLQTVTITASKTGTTLSASTPLKATVYVSDGLFIWYEANFPDFGAEP